MTRSRAKAIQDKVNSLLASLEFDISMNGSLPKAYVLCILRYEPYINTQERIWNWTKRLDGWRRPKEERRSKLQGALLPAMEEVPLAAWYYWSTTDQLLEMSTVGGPVLPDSGRYYRLFGTTTADQPPEMSSVGGSVVGRK